MTVILGIILRNFFNFLWRYFAPSAYVLPPLECKIPDQPHPGWTTFNENKGGRDENSPYLHDVIRLPGLVEERLRGAVEAKDNEEAFAGDGRQPVLAFAWRLWAEIDIGSAVGALHRFVHRVERREWLAVV